MYVTYISKKKFDSIRISVHTSSYNKNLEKINHIEVVKNIYSV